MPICTKLKGQGEELRCKGQLTVWTAGASGICGRTHEPEEEKRYGAFVKLSKTRGKKTCTYNHTQSLPDRISVRFALHF